MPDKHPTVTFKLPDGQDTTVPVLSVESTVNIQSRVVLDGTITAPEVALAILQALRDYWKAKAERSEVRIQELETRLADAKEELQHLRGSSE